MITMSLSVTLTEEPVQNETVTGPVTQRLTDAFSSLVEYDFVGQYLAHLDREP